MFKLERADTVLTITFDDGGMNLLRTAVLRELTALVRQIRSDAGQPSVVLFRSGRAGLFAAGADMAEMRRFSGHDALEFARTGQETMRALERLPMLTVAVVDGDCFGGALDLILAFDVRCATARSRFSHPGARLGIVTGFGGTSRWRRVIDPSDARHLFLGNGIWTAADALEAGLVDAIGAPSLAELASVDRRRVRMLKEFILHGAGASRSHLARVANLLGELHSF